MLKHELIEAVSILSGQDRDAVRNVLHALKSVVIGEISKGEDVRLSGIGKIYLAHRGERPARNIKTGEMVIVPAHRRAAFRPSLELQEAAAKQ